MEDNSLRYAKYAISYKDQTKQWCANAASSILKTNFKLIKAKFDERQKASEMSLVSGD
jgi:hypothetical protein